MAIIRNTILFFIGGVIYICMELVWRGHTDVPSSFLLGGVALIIAGSINEFLHWDTPIWKQMFLSGTLITVVELTVGLLINQDYSIWDYRGQPVNLLGQICIAYSLLWMILSVLGIVIDDYVRHKLFGEEKPRYRLF
jgi:uncharacterized membrane protein